MIKREEHLKQVNRFHDLVESIDDKIQNSQNPDERLELLMKYYTLTAKIWSITDDAIETIKNALDEFEREE